MGFFVWWVMGGGFAVSWAIAAAFLVVSCPCDLGLAVRLALVCASMRAKKSEILIKTPEVYERAREIKTIVFDKTGTLTKGEISIKNVEFISHDSNLIVSLCYAMQENNPHPIAKAFVEYLKAKKERIVLEEKEYIIAKGVRAKYANDEYFLGSLEWIETIIDKKITQNRENVIAFSNKSEVLALFYLQDSIKEGAREMVESLQNIGIESVILSGDNVESVKKVAQNIGITEYYAGVSPMQKAEIIKQLQAKGGVCFVGDGINDALALKEASFGISFANATDLAKEVGDILLLRDDLSLVYKVFEISFATLKNIKENLFFAYVYNVVLIPIAAGVLYPAFGIVLQPAFAGGAMAFSSVSVVANALRISRLKLKGE